MEVHLNQNLYRHDQMVKALAHDIRGMLATVQLAVDRLMLHEDATVRRQCSLIERVVFKATEYCSNTVCDLREKNEKTVSSNLFFQDIDIILKPLAEANNVDYNVIFTDAIIPQSIAKKLQRVLVNLGRNSIKAQTGQTSARLVTLFDVVENEIAIEIIDNGPGMPSDIIDELSEHIGSPIPLKKKKLGMGLTSSYAFIGELGGQINIFNAGVSGTKFQIRIPFRNAHEARSNVVTGLTKC